MTKPARPPALERYARSGPGGGGSSSPVSPRRSRSALRRSAAATSRSYSGHLAEGTIGPVVDEACVLFGLVGDVLRKLRLPQAEAVLPVGLLSHGWEWYPVGAGRTLLV